VRAHGAALFGSISFTYGIRIMYRCSITIPSIRKGARIE
jgi:hypothetical protein